MWFSATAPWELFGSAKSQAPFQTESDEFEIYKSKSGLGFGKSNPTNHKIPNVSLGAAIFVFKCQKNFFKVPILGTHP